MVNCIVLSYLLININLVSYKSYNKLNSFLINKGSWICIKYVDKIILHLFQSKGCKLFALVIFSAYQDPWVQHLQAHHNTEAQHRTEYTNTHICSPVLFSISRAESESNPWVVLTSSLLTHCQESGAKLDLAHQVVTMVRSLYDSKHKLPVQVNNQQFYPFVQLLLNAWYCFYSFTKTKIYIF